MEAVRVLFVSSANSGSISPIIKNQGDSLVRAGVSIDYFAIEGKGVRGYLKNVPRLRKHIKSSRYDVVHAHYSLSAFVASMAGAKPLLVSLMGSDVKSSRFYKVIIKLFAFCFQWRAIIVKSQDMYNDLGIKRAKIILNGVDTERFKPYDKQKCQKKLSWDTSKKHILFTANPNRPEKNYKLALDSVSQINSNDVELHYMKDVPNEETPFWYNAADVILLTSLWEGSPNVVKESMACNRPIVSTKVGDVCWLFGDEKGHYLISFEVDDCLRKIKEALIYSTENECTNGRARIEALKINSECIAQRVINTYKRYL